MDRMQNNGDKLDALCVGIPERVSRSGAERGVHAGAVEAN